MAAANPQEISPPRQAIHDYQYEASPASRAYPFIYNIIPLLGGLFDPFLGALGTIVRICRPYRITPRADTPQRRKRGLCIVLGGIEGLSQYGMKMVNGLLASRYRGSVVQAPWNKCVLIIGALRNLMSPCHHEEQSDAIVKMICEYRKEHPTAPISIFAQSGGCFITLRTLEKLPPEIDVHCAVMLAPSVSPGYDIRPAASRCTKALYSLGGPGDFFFLGMGTLILGTSDRIHTPSAGLLGWHHKSPRFIEMRWHPRWLRHGYVGNHLTTANLSFIQSVIPPLLQSDSHESHLE
jgi:hypothetical protein